MISSMKLKYAASINDEALAEMTSPDYELQYIDIGNVDSNGSINDVVTYAFQDAPSRARRVVRHGDVIVSTVRTYLQAIASIENPPENLIVSTGFAVVRPKSLLHPNFCKHALREPAFMHEVVSRSVGISYPAINSSELGDIQIPLPEFAQQDQIADFLDHETTRIDSLIAAKENHLTLIAEKRRALITSAVTRGIAPKARLKDSTIPWLGEIPEHWDIERAKWLFKQSNLPVRDEDEMVTCFRDGQVTLRKNRREDGFTNAIKELGYQGIREGHLMLHSMDAFAGAIGVSDSEGKCSPEYIICDPTTDKTLNHYYGHLLRVMALNGFIQASCPAVRERAPRIRYNDFADMFLPVPPLSEQQHIVDTIRKETAKLDALKTATDRTIALLRERRTALIAAAVTGKIDIPSIKEEAK